MRWEKGEKHKLKAGGGTEMHAFPQTEALHTQTKDSIFFYVHVLIVGMIDVNLRRI